MTNALKQQSKDKKDIHIVGKDKQYVYIAFISQNSDEILPFEEIKPPDESHRTLREKAESFARRIKEIELLLGVKSEIRKPLKKYLLFTLC